MVDGNNSAMDSLTRLSNPLYPLRTIPRLTRQFDILIIRAAFTSSMLQTELIHYLRSLLLPYCRAFTTMKRFRASEDTGPPSSKKARPSRETHISHISEAARFNDMVLRKLQRAYAVNPEGDLLTIFPSGYSTCQAGRKERDEGGHTYNTLRAI